MSQESFFEQGATKRQAVFPPGRVGTLEFCRISGIGRTRFLTTFRTDPKYIEQFDILIDILGRLNMSERAARHWAKTQIGGRPPHGNVGRSPARRCPECGTDVHPRRKVCLHCGHLFGC